MSPHAFAARTAWTLVRPVLRPVAAAALDLLLGPEEDVTRPNTDPRTPPPLSVEERLHAVAICVEWERGIRADERRRIREGDCLRCDQLALNVAPELMSDLTAGIPARFVRLEQLPDGSVDMIVGDPEQRDDGLAA